MMKPPPRLRFEPRPSRLGWAILVLACASISGLVAWLTLPVWATVACALAIVATLVAGYRQLMGRGVPAFVLVGADRRITVGDLQGRVRDGPVLDDSYVGEWLTTVVWQADGDPWWRPARVILVVPDTIARGDFRALRVTLRYGRAVETSASEAG